MTLTGTITPGQSGPGSNGDETVLHIPPNSKTEASPSDGFASYLEDLVRQGGLTPFQRSSQCIGRLEPTWLEHQ